MDRRGFTLVELLATLVILGIIMGIVVITVLGGVGNAKDKTEEAFIATIEDALDIYLDSDGENKPYDAKNLEFNTKKVCSINKTHGTVSVDMETVNFYNVINSEFNPIAESDLVNPANKDVSCEKSNNITVNIYRDSDYVYYYSVEKDKFKCLNSSDDVRDKIITNLPCDCQKQLKEQEKINNLTCNCLEELIVVQGMKEKIDDELPCKCAKELYEDGKITNLPERCQ